MRSGTGWGRGSRITTGSGTLQTHPAAVSATTRTRPTSATSTVFIGGPLLERPGDLGAEGGARRRLRDGNPTEREREKSDAEGDDLVPLGAGFDACHFRALPKLEDGRRKARALRRFAHDRGTAWARGASRHLGTVAARLSCDEDEMGQAQVADAPGDRRPREEIRDRVLPEQHLTGPGREERVVEVVLGDEA